ncbi:hypothetical protein [Flavobacterium anhuiense]|uniref:hypothetical protein n=1 Tax=Flavobacterium anhuiense TaxID=459526 RepID=UPI0020275D66|nr:hypothetical protein [Flavobacterium anhuiense]URM37695.1 hypothetical protein LLY39_03765 [Flavobacterium anhuiense]
MTEISGVEFERKINSKEKLFNDLIINIEKKITLFTQDLNIELKFKNVIFKGENLTFKDFEIENTPFNRFCIFEDCTFNCDVNFTDSTFKYLKFIACVIENKFFQITNCKINDLSFRENDTKINAIKPSMVKSGMIRIINGRIKEILIENIVFLDGTLHISSLNHTENCSIIRSTLCTIVISHSIFSKYFNYFNNTSIESTQSLFNRCTFPVSSFAETTFNDKTHFTYCIFDKISSFQSIKNHIKGEFKFTDCDFHKFTDFDKSQINKLRLEKNKFHDFVSFQETNFNIVEIEKTSFEKGAFFDDIQIKKIDNCNRRTIRTIKQQLQKAENKIDYNRFRVYEFNAYKDDIKNKLKEFEKDKNHLNRNSRELIQLKRDAFILWISEIVSEYGTDWKRALKFTLFFGSILYFSFFVSENYMYKIELFNFENFTRFTSGFFRFFLVTDFFNPLDNDRTYLTNPLSWLIFIFGKIVIAFGIYEMVQSFRKFKA